LSARRCCGFSIASTIRDRHVDYGVAGWRIARHLQLLAADAVLAVAFARIVIAAGKKIRPPALSRRGARSAGRCPRA